MRAPRYALVGILAIALAGCSSSPNGTSLVATPEGGKKVEIDNSPGGNVAAFRQAFSRWARIPGIKVEIRRWCASACTQVFSWFPRNKICLAAGTRIGFHSARALPTFVPWGPQNPNAPATSPREASVTTLLMFAAYPGWIQRRLSSAGVMGLRPGNPAKIIDAREFWNHGYSECHKHVRPKPMARVEERANARESRPKEGREVLAAQF